MNTKDLQYFEKLVETKSYTKTAKFFKLSQPSITTAIKRLNQEFHTKLVYQKFSRGRLIITPSGEVLYQRAKEIQHLLKVTSHEVYRANDAKLILGVSPVAGRTFLPDTLVKLKKAGLRERLATTEAGSNMLFSDLENGSIDAGLINAINPINNHTFKSKILRKNSVKLIASEENELAKKNKVKFSSLVHKNFITMAPQFLHRQIYNHYCRLAKIHPSLAYITDNISLLVELVRKNLGIALVTEKAAEGISGIKTLTITDVPALSTYTVLVLRQDYYLTPTQRKVINIITS